jgi:hypothetical protein
MGLNNNLGKLAEALTVSGSNNYVGVGLTTPGEKLDVIGNIRAKYAANSSNISFEPDFAQVYLVASSADNTFGDKKMVINSSGLSLRAMGTSTAAMEITSGGNVGIGTTSPNALLNVVTTTGKSTISIGDTAAGTYSQVLMYGGASRFNWSLGAQYNISDAFEITPSTVAGGTTFSTPAFVVTSNSKVGIGTTSPDPFKLAVNGTIGVIGTLGNTLGSYYIDHSGVQSWKIGVTTANTSTLSIGNDVGGAFANKIMNFTNSGNVGIGTTSPTVKLDVQASGVAGWFTSTSDAVPLSVINNGTTVSTVGFKGSTTDNQYVVRCGADGNDFITYTNNTEKLRITSAGRVGIGTASPETKLHIVSNDNANWTTTVLNTASGGHSVYTGYNNSTTTIRYGVYITGGGNDIYSYDLQVGSGKLLVRGDGNVGIGTTTPGTKLTVAGGVEATSLSLQGNYNTYVATDSSWSSYQTLITPGTLSPFKTYMISIWWTYSAGSNQPYYYTCAFLWQGASTNGTGTDNEFTPIGATHTGGTGATMSFRSIGAMSATTGIQARLNGFPTTGGNISVRATIIQGF